MSKIAVPEGMLNAVILAIGGSSDSWSRRCCTTAAEAVLRWLDAKLKEEEDPERRVYYAIDGATDYWLQGWKAAIKQVRSMFLAPEPEKLEFMECDSCRVKPGSPPLCAGCLHNREVIENLRKVSR